MAALGGVAVLARARRRIGRLALLLPAAQPVPRPPAASLLLHPHQLNSVSETLSTLNFGKGVTEITLGAAKRNAESGAAWEAKERALKSERDAAGAAECGGVTGRLV